MFEKINYIFKKCNAEVEQASYMFVLDSYQYAAAAWYAEEPYVYYLMWVDVYASGPKMVLFDSDEYGKMNRRPNIYIECPDVLTRFTWGLLNWKINKPLYFNFFNCNPSEKINILLIPFFILLPSDKADLFRELLIDHYGGIMGFKKFREELEKAVSILKKP